MLIEEITLDILNGKRLNESGIKDIKKISKHYTKAEIYFHIDLDGVTSAIGIKKFLDKYGIKTVDAHPIQYGDMEYSIPVAKKGHLNVMVDFSHGKPTMHIHTDHHDKQIGVGNSTSNHFRQSPSNAESISALISTSDLFPSEDIKFISMIDSADFAKNNISPDMVMRSAFNKNPELNIKDNKQALGFAVNKLVLKFKNKKDFLKKLVIASEPSLISMYNNVIRLAKLEGYEGPEEVDKGTAEYQAQQMKSKVDQVDMNVLKRKEAESELKKEKGSKYLSKKEKEMIMDKYPPKYTNVKPENVDQMKDGESTMIGNTIIQIGGGNMFKGKTYDRYTPFKLWPDAHYMCIKWPMGLLQVSKNPFKKASNPYHLSDVASKIIEKKRGQLANVSVNLESIKRDMEKKSDEISMGFNFNDFTTIFSDEIVKVLNEPEYKTYYFEDKLFSNLEEQAQYAEAFTVLFYAFVNEFDMKTDKIEEMIDIIDFLTPSKIAQKLSKYRNARLDQIKRPMYDFFSIFKDVVNNKKNIRSKQFATTFLPQAIKLRKEFGKIKPLELHWHSDIYEEIRNIGSKISGLSPDKWNPGDIFIIKNDMIDKMRNELDPISLNSYFATNPKEKDKIISISLKAASKTAKSEYKEGKSHVNDLKLKITNSVYKGILKGTKIESKKQNFIKYILDLLKEAENDIKYVKSNSPVKFSFKKFRKVFDYSFWEKWLDKKFGTFTPRGELIGLIDLINVSYLMKQIVKNGKEYIMNKVIDAYSLNKMSSPFFKSVGNKKISIMDQNVISNINFEKIVFDFDIFYKNDIDKSSISSGNKKSIIYFTIEINNRKELHPFVLRNFMQKANINMFFEIKSQVSSMNEVKLKDIEPGLKKMIQNINDKKYKELTDEEKSILKRVIINGYDIIKAQSGGHKDITNISGFGLLGKKGYKLMDEIFVELVKEVSKMKLDESTKDQWYDLGKKYL